VATHVVPGGEITLAGQGTDPEDGTLSGASLQWHSSADGELGTGATVTATLSEADHWVFLEARDSKGLSARDSVLVVVQGPVPGIDRPLTPMDAAAGFAVGRVIVRYADGVLPTAELDRINAQYGMTAQGFLPDLALYAGPGG